MNKTISKNRFKTLAKSLAKNGIEMYVRFGTVMFLTFWYLKHNSTPCVQQSTATA